MGSHRLPATPAAEPARLDSLTGLRIIAALWVLLLHFTTVTAAPVYPPVIAELVSHGSLGVDLFFVLSGFILCHVYATTFRERVTGPAYRSFLGYRFARLYPVHLVTFLLMVALYVGQIVLTGSSTAEAPERYGPLAIVKTLTMTHAWFDSGTPNFPAWSISAEWFAYLLFPVLCVLVLRVRFAAAGFSAVGIGLAVAFQIDNDLIRVMAGFLVGMATHQLRERIGAQLRRMPFLGSLVVAMIVGWLTVWGVERLEIGIVLFAALVLALAGGTDWLCLLLGRRAMVYLGEVSYSVYMLHWPVRVVVRTLLQKVGFAGSIPIGLVLLAYVAATLLAAVLLHHLVERPWRIRLRRLLAPRPAAADGNPRDAPPDPDMRPDLQRSAQQ